MIADLTPEQLKARYEPKPARVAATERQLHAAQFTPAGTRLIGGGYDSLVRLWDVTAKEPAELATNDTHQGWVQGLALHPTEKLAYTADSFGRLQCLGYANDTLDVKWYLNNAHDGWIRVVAINKDASTLVSAGRDKTIRSWNPVDGAARSTRSVEGADIYQCVFHPDGKRFASGDAHGTVTLWSVDQQAPLGKYDASELFSVQRLQDVGAFPAHRLQSRSGVGARQALEQCLRPLVSLGLGRDPVGQLAHRPRAGFPVVVLQARFQDCFGTYHRGLSLFADHLLGQVDNPLHAVRDLRNEGRDEHAGPSEPRGQALVLDEHQLELHLTV